MGRRKIYFFKILSVLILFLSINMVSKVYPLCGEESVSSKEFILQGLKHNLSLIKDVQAKYVDTIYNTTGKKMTAEIEWKYKYNQGKEYQKIILFDEESNAQKTLIVSLDYLQGSGISIEDFSKANIASAPLQGNILERKKVWKYTNNTLPSKIPPSSLFWSLWSGGVTIEEILSEPKTKILPEKEFIEDDECYVVYLDKFWKESGSLYEKKYGFGYKIWMAPQKGFLPRKIEILIPGNEKPLYIFGPIVLKKFEEKVWFPVSTEVTAPFASKPEDSKKTIKYLDIKINQGINDNIFNLTFTPGTQVHDEILGMSYTVPF